MIDQSPSGLSSTSSVCQFALHLHDKRRWSLSGCKSKKYRKLNYYFFKLIFAAKLQYTRKYIFFLQKNINSSASFERLKQGSCSLKGGLTVELEL